VGYNVTSVDYISGKLTITREKIIEAVERLEDEMPEAGFIQDFLWNGRNTDPADLPDGPIKIEVPGFYGCGARDGLEACESWLWAMTKGKAEILIVWEGGDGYDGYLVENGQVTKKKVKHGLV
jgi:hypothetical protein